MSSTLQESCNVWIFEISKVHTFWEGHKILKNLQLSEKITSKQRFFQIPVEAFLEYLNFNFCYDLLSNQLKDLCTKYLSRRVVVAKFSSCSLEKLVFILASPSEKFDLKGDNSWRVYDCFTRLLTCFFFRGNSCFRSVLLAFLRIKVALPALCLFTLFSEYFLKMPISPQPKAPTLYYCLGPSETGARGAGNHPPPYFGR